MSSKVKGWLAWASAGRAKARTRRERRMRRMKDLHKIIRRDVVCYVSADSIRDRGERDVASNVSTANG
jgi:hypothetical protein